MAFPRYLWAASFRLVQDDHLHSALPFVTSSSDLGLTPWSEQYWKCQTNREKDVSVLCSWVQTYIIIVRQPPYHICSTSAKYLVSLFSLCNCFTWNQPGSWIQSSEVLTLFRLQLFSLHRRQLCSVRSLQVMWDEDFFNPGLCMCVCVCVCVACVCIYYWLPVTTTKKKQWYFDRPWSLAK